jgi:2-polyprenyl-6-methoxyphenol hydroxylase-like FAD-dependent oxidoreductase
MLLFLPINDLEARLTSSAQRLGIDLRFEEEVTALRGTREAVHLTLRNSRGTRELSARYSVLAAGASSTLAESLGLKRQAVGFSYPKMMSGIFEQPGSGEITVLDDFGHAVLRQGGPQVTVLAELPDGLRFANDAARRKFLRDKAHLVGVTSNLLRPPRDFDVTLTQLDHHVAGERIFAIGDSARRTHPWVGEGANLALYDALRVGRLIGALEATPQAKRRAVLRRDFDAEMGEATRLTHAHAHTQVPRAR